MATSKEYLEYIMGQLYALDEVSARMMMGEYLIYYRGKIVGGIYDGRMLVKDIPAARAYMPEASLQLPYEGAKPMLFVENTDNAEWFCGLFEAMYDELPAPKPRKPRKPKK